MATGLVNKHGNALANVDSYKATQLDRTKRRLPNVTVDSKETNTQTNRLTLMGLSRFLYQNSSIVRGVIGDLTKFSMGSNGLKAQSLANADNAELYNDYFTRWGRICDLEGRLTLDQIQNLVSLRMDVDGDILVNLVKLGGSGGVCKLQLIEGHRIQADYGDQRFIDGVQIDRFGRTKNYSVKTNDKYKLINSNNAVLVSDPTRVSQYRGVSLCAPIIDTVNSIETLLEFEQTAALLQSAISFAISSPDGISNDGSSFIDQGFEQLPNHPVQDTWRAGTIPRLSAGEKIEPFQTTRPSNAFASHVDFLTRQISIATGLPFEFSFQPTGLSSTATRFVLKKAERTFVKRQQLIGNQLMSRLWSFVIGSGISKGDLPSDDNWWRVSWVPERMPSTDVFRESSQIREDVKMGLKTLGEVSAADGKDWRLLRDQSRAEAENLLDHAVALQEKYGLTLGAAISLLSSRTSTGYPFTAEPTEDELIEPSRPQE